MWIADAPTRGDSSPSSITLRLSVLVTTCVVYGVIGWVSSWAGRRGTFGWLLLGVVIGTFVAGFLDGVYFHNGSSDFAWFYGFSESIAFTTLAAICWLTGYGLAWRRRRRPE